LGLRRGLARGHVKTAPVRGRSEGAARRVPAGELFSPTATQARRGRNEPAAFLEARTAIATRRFWFCNFFKYAFFRLGARRLDCRSKQRDPPRPGQALTWSRCIATELLRHRELTRRGQAVISENGCLGRRHSVSLRAPHSGTPAWSHQDRLTRLLARVTRRSGCLHLRNDTFQVVGLRRMQRWELLVRLQFLQP
jgi:hypothetical protein